MNTTEEQIKNAIKWIDELPNYKQAPIGKRSRLGDADNGYCCLGAGCVITDVKFDSENIHSNEFARKVGLNDSGGALGDNWYYNQKHLTDINDNTNAGFKRISNLMKTHPDWMFEKEVAEGIRKHYNK